MNLEKIDLNINDLGNSQRDTRAGIANDSDRGFDTTVEEYDDTYEMFDEDDIKIIDTKAPILLLFGPPASGKSMTLVRLARYLRNCGYVVTADKTFKADDNYRARCEQFQRNLNTKEALEGNALNEFLMVKVVKNGTTLCQILEAPGEHYFDPKKPENISATNFRPYLTEIVRTLPNRKIWVFLTEAEWNVHSSVKDAYVARIRNCKNHLMKATDRVVILYNKVDRKEELFQGGHLMVASAEKAMRDEYSGLPVVFKNTNPITSLWRSVNYRFVPFCTGYYNTKIGGRARYNESEDKYPAQLWDELIKCIRG